MDKIKPSNLMQLEMKDLLWIDLESIMPNLLNDYPTTLTHNIIAAVLQKVNFSLKTVTAEEALLLVQYTPRILLFSATTSEWPKAISLASQVRRISPMSILIVGGYHVSALPADSGTELFDYVVVGEGEEAILSIMYELSNKETRSVIARKSKVLRAERIQLLDNQPSPLRCVKDIQNCRLRGLMFPSPSIQTGAASFLLSRGCNNNCSFCASHLVWGSQLITRTPYSAVNEIKKVIIDSGCNSLVFIDQAFGEDKKWTYELCEQLQKSGIPEQARWFCMAKTSLDMTLLEDMASAGCSKIGFGVETADIKMRKTLKHNDSASLDELNCLFSKCNDLGIITKVFLIIGFPWETPEYLLETMTTFLEKLNTNEIKISYFTPFPGTDDWVSYQNLLVTNNWEDFDTVSMPVVYNSRISISEYNKIKEFLYQSFYGSVNYSYEVRKMIQKYPDYLESYQEFATYLLQLGLILDKVEWLDFVQQDTSAECENIGR